MRQPIQLPAEGSVADCSGLLGRTSLRHSSIWDAWSGPDGDCSGLLGRTSLRLPLQSEFEISQSYCSGLLGRTSLRRHHMDSDRSGVFPLHCSGLLGRTSLRLGELAEVLYFEVGLFRPSRPDFIETCFSRSTFLSVYDCSGLLGRTSLRLRLLVLPPLLGSDCSGLLGRTSLRRSMCQLTP